MYKGNLVGFLTKNFDDFYEPLSDIFRSSYSSLNALLDACVDPVSDYLSNNKNLSDYTLEYAIPSIPDRIYDKIVSKSGIVV